jgi:hypothetical protein
MSDTTYQVVKYVGTIGTILKFAEEAQTAYLKFARVSVGLVSSGALERLEKP